MSVSYLLKYIFYVFIIFCLVSHRFPVGIRVLNGGGGGGGGGRESWSRIRTPFSWQSRMLNTRHL